MTARKSKRGKTYYSCSSYPACKFMSWDIPTGDKCPKCGQPMIQTARGNVKCSNKDCSQKPPKSGDEGENKKPPLEFKGRKKKPAGGGAIAAGFEVSGKDGSVKKPTEKRSNRVPAPMQSSDYDVPPPLEEPQYDHFAYYDDYDDNYAYDESGISNGRDDDE